MYKRSVSVLFLFFVLLSPTYILAVDKVKNLEFTLDKSHSKIRFSVSHLMITDVEGEFRDYKGQLILNDKGELVFATADIVVKSIDTGIAERDDHLRSPDFFNAEKMPEISFRSTSVSQKDGKLKITGDLTIKGITKKITLDGKISKVIKDPWGGTRVGITLESKINRKDFNMKWNKLLEAGGVAVGEEVKLDIKLEGLKK